MPDFLRLPLVDHDKLKWGALAYFGKDHEIACEDFKVINQRYSFRGGHRVRLVRLKKQVYWKIPLGTNLDISDVPIRRPQGS
jgi:hypothetical protein